MTDQPDVMGGYLGAGWNIDQNGHWRRVSPEPCLDCYGTGECQDCHGTGDTPTLRDYLECETCHGTGDCPWCDD